MILKVDAKALEWRSYIELSRDPVGISEITSGEDVHSNNQQFFNLPSRLISKVFLFRWIYRGSAWAYANDNDFIPTSSDPNYWQNVINAANAKYKVLYQYQEKTIYRAQKKEVIQIPSGREFLFEMSRRENGEYYWDIKKIVNYINQGFGADIMSVVRGIIKRKLRKYPETKYKLFNTVHDDVQVDVDNDPDLLYNICIDLENSFTAFQQVWKEIYDKEFLVPLAGEVSFGKNLLDLVEFKKEKGKEQFYVN